MKANDRASRLAKLTESAAAAGACEITLHNDLAGWQRETDEEFRIDEGAHWKPVLARLRELGFEVVYEAADSGGVKRKLKQGHSYKEGHYVTLRWLDES